MGAAYKSGDIQYFFEYNTKSNLARIRRLGNGIDEQAGDGKSVELKQNAWHHFMIVFDVGCVELYINGSLITAGRYTADDKMTGGTCYIQSYYTDIELKLILPTEAQASLINSDMSWAEVIDTIGLPQKDYGSGIYIFEFYLRDGHRLWIYTDGFRIGNTSDIVHSDYPYQTYEDYLERKYKEKDSAFAVTPWNNMYGTAANSLPDAA